MSKKTKQKKATPRLRFPEFREAKGWNLERLSSRGGFLPSLTGKTASDFDRGDASFIPYMNVFSNAFTDKQDLRAVDVKAGERQNAVAKGDVFFTVSSETPEDAGMSSVLVEDIEKCYLNSFCALFRFNDDESPNPLFLGHLLRTSVVRKHLARGAQGATRYNISKGTFRDIPILLPTPDEQHKIASCLGTLDDWIDAESRALAALRRHKTGLMQQLFPRPGQTRPRLRFPEFQDAGEWEVSAFDSLYEFKPTNNYSRDQLNYNAGTVKNIHYGDIHTRFATSFRVNEEAVPYVNADALPDELNPDLFCQPGEVIFADASEDVADVGKCIEVVEVGEQQVLSGSHTIRARPLKESIVVGFGGYLFKSAGVRKTIEKEAQGSKVTQISAKRLATVDVCHPKDLAEQSRIATCLASLDARLAAQAEKLASLGRHKRGLMQQLFPSAENSSRSGG